VVVPGTGVVSLPPGAVVDPGAIGKGLAADLVSAELVADGAAGALVSVGGDLRVAGRAPAGGWIVALDHDGSEPIGSVALVAGGVATSSILRRRWWTPAGRVHHVIDPRTGRPTSGAAIACTVVAGEAWWAEALATAVIVAWEESDGPEVAMELLGDAAALVTTATGDVVRIGSDDVDLEPVAA
jgi:thiamine biosynthesis lipoprotein